MVTKVITMRSFMKLIRPILNIEQERIRKIQITAEVNNAVIMEIECFATHGADLEINEIESDGATKRYILEVMELD